MIISDQLPPNVFSFSFDGLRPPPTIRMIFGLFRIRMANRVLHVGLPQRTHSSILFLPSELTCLRTRMLTGENLEILRSLAFLP